MGWSSGVYTKGNSATGGWTGDAASGIGIEAGRHDTQDNDFATGINTCLTKDGQNNPTANLPMGGFKHTGVANGSANTDYMAYGQIRNGTPLFMDTTNNRLGINTSTPGSALEIQTLSTTLGTNGNTITQFSNAGGEIAEVNLRKSRGTTLGTNTIVQSGDYLGAVRFWGANGTGYSQAALVAALVDGTPGATNDMPGALAFWTTPDGSGNPSERMRIASSGNVGIGEIAPATLLQIKGGTINVSGLPGTLISYFAAASASNNNSGVVIGNINGNNPYLAASKLGDGTGTNFDFYTNDTFRMRITGDGKVGIGPNNPSASLEIQSFVSSQSALIAYNTQTGLSTAAATFRKVDNNTTTSNVLVTFTVNGAGAGSGQINANGASQAAFGSFSDRRLKENISDLPNQLSAICELRPVEFDYKDGSGHQIGFIAQEVQAVYPDLVGQSEDNYLTLSGLGKNEARLIKALQELNAKVEALEARVTELEK